jgi:hypothetical protein
VHELVKLTGRDDEEAYGEGYDEMCTELEAVWAERK